MQNRKTQETHCEASPCAIVLALAVNNLVDMRIRKKLKARNEKMESTTSTSSEVISVDKGQCAKHVAELCSWKGKKKRNKPSKRQSNGLKHDNETDTLLNNSLLMENSSTCPIDDVKSVPQLLISPLCKQNRNDNMECDKEAVQPEIKNTVAGVAFSCYVNEHERLDPAESGDVSPDLEARCGSSVLTSRSICSSLQSDTGPVLVANGKVDISLIGKCDKDDGVANVSSDMKILRTNQIRGLKTYARRKMRGYASSKVNSNSIPEDTSSLVQHRMGNISSDHSGRTLPGGCSQDVDKKMLVERQGSLLQVAEDVRVEKVTDGCTDLACAMVEKEGRMDMNNSMAKTAEGCYNKDEPLADNLEENIEKAKAGEHGILLKGKACGNESGKITPDEPVDRHSMMMHSNSSDSRNDSSQFITDVNSSLRNSLIASSKKKLLVLDLNGLIAEIIRYVPERHTPDAVISMKAVFKRPFYEDFLQFCFARFNVGVWSSRAKSNVQSIVDFLLGDAKQNLLFCWDQSHCTETGFYTVENRHKPLLVKKLQKLWEKYEPDLPWEVGEYNEVNTLMLDDSPYKALLNPPHTAIFPPSYRHTNKADDSLGPGGALRIYLEGLANAENVQKYVKENPFGQRPITEKNASWRFYQRVIEAIPIEPRNAHNRGLMNGPDWGMQRSEGDMNAADKALDKCPVSHDQSVDDSPSRHTFVDAVRSDWGGIERRRGDWNTDYRAQDKHPVSYQQRASDYHDRYTSNDANRQDRRARIRGGDWNRAYRDQDKHLVSYGQKASGFSDGYSLSFDVKGSDRSWGIQRGGDWNCASRDLDKHPVSYDQKASRYPNRHLSFDTPGSDRSRGIQRGQRDRNRDYQAPDKRPVSLDQRVSGYPYNSRYSRFSFHWQAYR